MRTQPLALSPAGTTPLTLIGERLAPGGTLWTSFPAQITSAGSAGTNPLFNVTLSSNLPPGFGALRFANSNGISDLQLIMIDPLPGVVSVSGNTNIDTAQPLKPPIAVDGYCNELESRFYRVELKSRQRVVIETIANRIGSALDPFVRVLNDNGHELASVDDTPGCGADARLEFIAPKAGSYLIEVRDTHYSGGPDFFYRLRVGDSGAGPLRFLPMIEPMPLISLSLPVVREEEVGAGPTGMSDAQQRGKARAAATGGKDVNASRTPQTLRPPVLIRGGFDRPNDRDVYEFDVGKDERWIVRGRTRSLGSPCDLYLRLEKPDGTLIVEADATGADEGSLTNKFSDSGTVRLVVEELNHGGGPGFDYEIELVPFEPGFVLTVTTNTVEVAPGGSLELKVNAARRDFDGPISLSLAGLGEEFNLTNHIIAEKQTTNTLTVTVLPTLVPGSLATFTIVGRAELGGRRIESCAGTMPSVKAQFPQVLYPPRELDGLIWLGIKSDDAASK